MDITRRSFLAGLGSVSVGLLFARKLDVVLDSLVAEQQAPDQQPSAAEIVVLPQMEFRPDQLVVSTLCAPLFVIEDIRIGAERQVTNAISAEMFSADAFDRALVFNAISAGAEIRFRVRYVGKDPQGARFQAMLLGTSADGAGRLVLPIDSGCAIVS